MHENKDQILLFEEDKPETKNDSSVKPVETEIKNNPSVEATEVETKEYITEKFKNAKVDHECPICGSGSKIEFAAYGGGVYLDCNLKQNEHNRKATEEEKRVFFKSGKGERQPGEFGR